MLNKSEYSPNVAQVKNIAQLVVGEFVAKLVDELKDHSPTLAMALIDAHTKAEASFNEKFKDYQS